METKLMGNKDISAKKHILKYGVLLGIFSITFNFFLYITGNYVEQNLIHPLILLFISITGILGGLIMYKKNNDGYIGLGQGLKIGIGISLTGAILIVLCKITLMQAIDPDIITQIENTEIKKLAEKSAEFTRESIDKKIASIRKYTSPLTMIIIAFTENLFLGFTVSLIGGLIIQKKRDPFK